MHYFSGQTVMPTYTDPIMSIPGSANISQKNELVLHVSQVPPRSSIPPIGPISDEMFDRYVQRWQNRQRPARPTSRSGSPQSIRPVAATSPTGLTGHVASQQQNASTSAQPNSSSGFEKMIWLVCLEKIWEWMLEVKLVHIKSRILLCLIWMHTLLILGCLSLLNSMGKILEVLLSISVSILPN